MKRAAFTPCELRTSLAHILESSRRNSRLLQHPAQRYRALFELSLMMEDPSSRIKECSAAAVQPVLSLPHSFCGQTALDASQSSIFLEILMDHLKIVGGWDMVLWGFQHLARSMTL
jgi:hypothetical protein